MAALKPSGFVGRITWLGVVPDRNRQLQAEPLTQLRAGFDGPEGEAHGGLTRPACSRVKAQYPRGTEIRNTRQFSVLGAEELAEIAQRMGLASLDPALLGATMVIAGLSDFSRLPPSSRLQGEGGATLVVDMENRPCVLPGKPIEAAHPGYGKAFKQAAKGRRGITAWVEREGVFTLGEAIALHIPDQRVWAHLAEARRG
ncbi:MOSC domain-containing protein [Pseudotabrizicola algicola]|uniref:Sulfurase n=1 Tax=Pseudotabrizicola algicola TaxID=2709381 RepID=A0A6B3RVE2_9RHOB|nr:sulfurase [Pseudotabrizicola algicola]NEX47835.1 sulfurase [Pseudotabrizicola algicola]